MPLFAASWRVFPDKRSDAATFFASMSAEDHRKQMGTDIQMHTRVHNLANTTGLWVGHAKDAKAMHKFVWEWSEDLVDITVEPVLDDNMAREVMLGHAPAWTWTHDYTNAQDGEVIYLARFKFETCDSKVKGYNTFANMTKEDFVADQGACRPMGTWHNVGNGTGYCLCAVKSSVDVNRWAYKWASVANVDIEPVVMDDDAADIFKAKDGYDKKLATLMAKMGV